MYRYILFDLDGTLTDSSPGITNSVGYALDKYGITDHPKEDLLKFIGPPLVDSFAKFYGFDEAKSLEAVEFYREYFRDRGIYENSVYDGVIEVLEALKADDRILVLATSKPEEFAVRILEHFDIAKYFNFVAGASMDGALSKKSDVIAVAMNRAGIEDASTAIMIGDRHHDISGASVNGMESIGVLYGFGSRDELEAAGATYIASTPADILEITGVR